MSEDEDIPILIKPRVDLTQATKVTLENKVNDAMKKAEIYQLRDMDDVELTLAVIEEFRDICAQGRLDLSTGPIKYEKFRECLTGTARSDWDSVKDEFPHDNDGFAYAVDAFIRLMIDENDFEKQKAYMHKEKLMKKPYSMTVSTYRTRLKTMWRLMTWFPGAPEGNAEVFDEKTKKHQFNSGMPVYWQKALSDSGQTATLMTWPSLVGYYKMQKQTEGNQKKTGKAPNHSTSQKRQSDGGNNNTPQKRPKGNKPKENKGKRVDLCPFHPDGNHTWAQCFANEHSPNYKPGFKPRVPEKFLAPKKKPTTKKSDAQMAENVKVESGDDGDGHHLDELDIDVE